MSSNDRNRNRKTYSFFRAQPGDVLVTTVSGGVGINVTGNKSLVEVAVDTTVIPILSGFNAFTGSVVITDNLTVSGTGLFEGNLTTLSDLYASGNLTVSGTSLVEGNLTTLSDLYASGNLTVSGTGLFEGNLTTLNDLYVSGNLTVSGTGLFEGVLSSLSDIISLGTVTSPFSLVAVDQVVSGTSLVEGNLTTLSDLYVSGTIYANEFKTNLISSSIIFESGSTIFGDSSDDTHRFTGDLYLTSSNFALGAEPASWNSAQDTIFLADAGAAPTAPPIAGVYVRSTAGELEVSGSGGSATTIGDYVSAPYFAAGALPASAGDYRMSNNTYIRGRNAANTGDIDMFRLDGANNITFGQLSATTGIANISFYAPSNRKHYFYAGTLISAITANGFALGAEPASWNSAVSTMFLADSGVGPTAAPISGVYVRSASGSLEVTGISGSATTIGDYVSSSYVSTPYIELGTAPFSTTGQLRGDKDFQLNVRNSTNTSDVTILNFNGANSLLIGQGAGIKPVSITMDATSGIIFRYNGAYKASFDSGNMRWVYTEQRADTNMLFSSAHATTNNWAFGANPSSFNSAQDTIFIADSGAAPTAAPIAGVYVRSATGSLEVTGISGSATTIGDYVSSSYIELDSYVATGVTPADTGALRLTNNEGIYWRNAANSANFRGMYISSANTLYIGDGTQNTTELTTTSFLSIRVSSQLSYILYNTEFDCIVPLFSFRDTTSSPIIRHDDSTGTGTGETLLVKAQTLTGTGSIGGNLDLRAGDGVTASGQLRLLHGDGTAVAYVTDTKDFVVSGSGFALGAEPASWQSLSGGMFYGDAATEPTAALAAGVGTWATGGALKAIGSGGTVTTLAATGQSTILSDDVQTFSLALEAGGGAVTVFSLATTTDTDITVNVMCHASDATANETAGFVYIATFKNIGGTLSQVGASTESHAVKDDATWAFAVTGSSPNILFQGTPDASNETVFAGSVRVFTTSN